MLELNNSDFLWEAIRYEIAYERSSIAFRRLFSEFHQDLFQFGMSIIKVKEPVEDIIADIFLKIWLMEKRLMEVEHIKTYLFRALKNNALRYLQRQLIQEDIFSISDIPNTSTDIEGNYISRENLQIIQQAIDQLPAKCQMAFTLVKDLGYTYAETADIMEIAVNTVDRHVQLALQRLRSSLIKKISI